MWICGGIEKSGVVPGEEVGSGVGNVVQPGVCRVLAWNVARDLRHVDVLAATLGPSQFGQISLLFLSEVTVTSEQVTKTELGRRCPGTKQFVQTVRCGRAIVKHFSVIS